MKKFLFSLIAGLSVASLGFANETKIVGFAGSANNTHNGAFGPVVTEEYVDWDGNPTTEPIRMYRMARIDGETGTIKIASDRFGFAPDADDPRGYGLSDVFSSYRFTADSGRIENELVIAVSQFRKQSTLDILRLNAQQTYFEVLPEMETLRTQAQEARSEALNKWVVEKYGQEVAEKLASHSMYGSESVVMKNASGEYHVDEWSKQFNIGPDDQDRNTGTYLMFNDYMYLYTEDDSISLEVGVTSIYHLDINEKGELVITLEKLSVDTEE